MRKEFADPLKVKKVTKYSPVYDERSSVFVNKGCDYGVGRKNPVGHNGKAKEFVPTIPFGKVRVEIEEDKDEYGEH